MSGPDQVAGNRAVSALFRVFGGMGRREIADGFERTRMPGMHAGERLILGIIVPLIVAVGVSEWLVRWLGPIAGWLLVLPVGFVVLNLLASFVPGKKPIVQWRWWLLLLTCWAGWRVGAGGYVSVFAWLWLGVFALNALALFFLGVSRVMAVPGRAGIRSRAGLMFGLHVVALVAGYLWGWHWAVLGGAVIASTYCAAVLNPASRWLGPVRCFNDGREILITIDDGPDPRDTPRLLDLLDERGEKAVFFMIGEKVRAYPELAREVVKRGHEIGNHTMTHPQAMFWCAGSKRTRREIEECQRVILEVTGEKPRWFRAPVGHRNLFTHPIAGEMGMEVMGWSRRGFDAVSKDPKAVLEKILPVRGGDIVLMHEGTEIAVQVLEGILLGKGRDQRPAGP